MKDTQALREFLKISKNIVVTAHANPDADAIGSALAFHKFLESLGQQVTTIMPDSYADFLAWMPGNEEVVIYEENQEKADEILAKADLFCALDYSGYKRIKKMQAKAESLTAKVLLIDHHLNPEITPDFNFWDDKAAATAELVYDVIEDFSGKEVITADMAACLYAGIMTDTGSFKHPSTTSKIHRTVAELIDLGADVNQISRAIYDTNSLHRLRFLGYALAEKLVVDVDARVAYFIITEKDIEVFNLKKGDTEGLVNYALSIKGVVMAAIIINRDGEVKMSFRSTGDIAVNKFASDYFEGGGHKNAAGGISYLSLDETEKKFKELIKNNVLKTT